MNRQTIAAFAAAAAITAAFLTGTSVARSARSTPDNKIATINLEQVINQLQELKDKQQQLDNELASQKGRFNSLNETINRDRQAASQITDPAAREAELEKIVDRDVQLNLEAKKAEGKLEKAQANAVRAVFEKIQKEASALAAPAGYTMVMTSDDAAPIPARATTKEAMQILTLRRFIYVDKSHDITADLIKRMNDAYAKTKPAAPAPAPAAPGTPAPTNR